MVCVDRYNRYFTPYINRLSIAFTLRTNIFSSVDNDYTIRTHHNRERYAYITVKHNEYLDNNIK